MKEIVLSAPMSYVALIVLVMVTLFIPVSNGASRSDTIKRICGNQLIPNPTAYIQTFVEATDNVNQQIVTQGWGISSAGTGPDSNYELAQCYGDLSLLDCVECFTEARTLIGQCFPYNSAKIYLDGCFMRGENYSFFQEVLGAEDMHVCGNDTRKDLLFQESARRAVLQAVSNAPNSNGYARVEMPVSGAQNESSSAYVLANCWKTLNASACKTCLENASNSMLKCLPWSEGRALYTGCFMRYSNHDFLNPIPTKEDSSGRGNVVVIVVTTLSSVVLLVLALVVGFYIWKRRRIAIRRRGSNDAENLVNTLHDISLSFKYSTLDKATGSFDEANKLGQGGFGTVYKGVLADGREIAVKRLILNYKHRASDFYNEVNIISSVEHKNLIRLLGCSCSGPESLLVYEFLPNLSLDRFIFDENKGKELNWEKRFNIMIGTAEGLVHLHENSSTRIIHRDIKASNILLDSRFRAKIADFGLARSFEEDKSHISTAVAGTLGYLPPEYLVHGQLSEKVDIYSFGVLLLEIITGKQNNMSRNAEYTDSLVNIVWKHFQEGRVDGLFDPNLILNNYRNIDVKNEATRAVHVGLLCTQEVASLRPPMSKVLQMLLNKEEEELPLPSNPPFMNEKIMQLNSDWDNPTFPLREGDSASIASMFHSSFYPR
ncbi:PREDICTED: cysteine-rich receptor-like protein kinase 2 isoform X2 [Ipomoea nil]|uniref:cysteine-rich receptor-like protein kinase 2 isoform X2 n=1 Tax=Ipomoea nil TaxID=35883 RepID=UPI0009010FB2|nr:PREDICTED: cysteine-rich receptor-like protein kinase 2 isoform X2 [Ipomoea nil]